jgi:hypothetical protein
MWACLYVFPHLPDLLGLVGRRLGLLLSGDRVNHEQAAAHVLSAFRAGKLGRLSLDHVGGGESVIAIEPAPPA